MYIYFGVCVHLLICLLLHRIPECIFCVFCRRKSLISQLRKVFVFFLVPVEKKYVFGCLPCFLFLPDTVRSHGGLVLYRRRLRHRQNEERAQRGLPPTDTLPPAYLFASSAFSKMCATITTYPHEVMRTRLREQVRDKHFFFFRFFISLERPIVFLTHQTTSARRRCTTAVRSSTLHSAIEVKKT